MTSTARTARRPAASTSPGLSRERVCREALALVDEEGLAALSMRRLGARLGVEAMSLYRHVRDKADLLDAIHAAVLGDLGAVRGGATPAAPATGDWRGLLTHMATALRQVLLRHPNVLPLFGTRPVRAAEATATIARVRQALLDAGFSEQLAAQVLKVVGVYTIGYALSDAHHTRDASAPRVEAFELGLGALLDGLAAHLPPRRSAARKPKGP